MLLMERARLWPEDAPIGPGLLGEGKPERREGEIEGETLRKRKPKRMPQNTGCSQGTCLTGLGPPGVGLWHPQGDLVL